MERPALLTPSKNDPPAVAHLKHLFQKELSERDEKIESLETELTETSGRLETAEQNMCLLKAVLCIIHEDVNIKNEQLENLYADLELNPVWQRITADDRADVVTRRMENLTIAGASTSSTEEKRESPRPSHFLSRLGITKGTTPPPSHVSARASSAHNASSSSSPPSTDKGAKSPAARAEIIQRGYHTWNTRTPRRPQIVDPKFGWLDAYPQPQPGVDYFGRLPTDMEFTFCEFLDYAALCAVAGVCSEWNRVASRELLWRSLYFRSWPDTEDRTISGIMNNTKSWREQYCDRQLIENNWVRGKPTQVMLHGHQGSITCLRYDKDRLVTASDDGSLILWQLHPPEEQKYSLVQQHHRQIRMTQKSFSFQGHGGPVFCCSLSGDIMTSGSYDKTVKVWGLNNGNCHLTLRGHTEWVSCVSSLSPSNQLVSGSWDTTLKLWQLSDSRTHGQCLQTLHSQAGDAVYTLQWDDQYRRVVSGNRHQSVKVWDVERGDVVRTYMGHRKQVYTLQTSEHRIVSGSGDHTIRMWDTRTANCIMQLNDHNGPVMTLQHDQYKIVSGSYDKQLKIFDIRMHRCIHSLSGHSAVIFSLQYDEEKIITGSADRKAIMWYYGRQKTEF